MDRVQEFRFYSDFKVSFQKSVIKSFVLHRTSWQQCGGRISGAELEEGDQLGDWYGVLGT